MRSTLLFFLSLFSPFFLFAEEPPPQPQLSDTTPQPVSLVNMTAEPSSFVNGSVNAISGNYISCSQEYAVSGPDPYVLGRSYTSFGLEKSNLGHGWSFQHNFILKVFQPVGIKYTKGKGPSDELIPKRRDPRDHPYNDEPAPPAEEKNSYTHLFIYEPYGGRVLFKGDGKAKHFRPVLKNTGYTNVGHGQISGQHNIKNTTISWDSATDEWTVTSGNGTVRRYERRSKQKKARTPGHYNFHYRDYQIVEEIKPSGNRVLYSYNSDYKIEKIKTVNHKNSAVLNWVTFHYEKHHSITVKTSDGHQFVYKLRRVEGLHERNRYVLYKVTRPGEPDELIEYNDHTHYHEPRVEKTAVANGNYTSTKYYHHNGNNNIGPIHQDIGDKRRKFLAGRVRYQESPVGLGGDPVITHAYFYHDADKEDKTSHTTVRDPYGNKTRYHYTKDKRLERIEREEGKEGKESQIIMTESFVWGKKDSDNEGHLLVRTLYDEKKEPLLSRTLDYDSSGNILKETFYGNFTGDHTGEIKFHSDGFPKEDSPCDKKIYRYTYSNDGFNLKLSERDPDGNYIYYEYKKGTNLLIARLTCEEKEIKKREFFSYDENAVLIEEIVDDGSSSHRTNFHDVTERHIKRYTPRKELPHFGAPEIIEEYYVEKKEKEKLLTRTVNRFNSKGWVISKQIFDNKGEFFAKYSYEYDDIGRVILSRDPLGRQERLEYDQFGHIVTRRGPRNDLVIHYEYDTAGRLIKEKELHRSGLVLANRYKYDFLGRKIAVVDPQGNETTYKYDSLNRIIQITLPSILDCDGNKIAATKSYRYAKLGRKVIETNELGQKTESLYSSSGKLFLTKLADGTTHRYYYDIKDRLNREYAANGLCSTHRYDIFDRIVKTEQKKGDQLFARKTNSYNTFHLLSQTGSTHEKTIFTYDAAGRKKGTIQIGEKGKESERKSYYRYDSMGRIAVESLIVNGENQNVISKQMSYDVLNRMVSEKIVDDEGGILHSAKIVEYDIEGNIHAVTQSINGQSSTTKLFYHPHGIPSKAIDALGNSTITEIDYFHRNQLGQYVLKKSVTDARGVKTVEIFNSRGHLVQQQRYDPYYRQKLSEKKLFYDAIGNQVRIEETALSHRDERTITTVLRYGPLQRLESIIEAYKSDEQKVTCFGYNKFGQKVVIRHANGQKIYHRYDGKGRLHYYFDTQKDIHYEYFYDASDRILKVINHRTGCATERNYNCFGEVINERLESGLLMQYSYDTLGRPLKTILPDGSAIAYNYSPVAIQKVMRLSREGNILYHSTIHERDLSGNILLTELPGQAGNIRYNYDLLGRVTKVEHPLITLEVPIGGYDPVGNLLGIVIQDPLEQKEHHFGYDFLSQMTVEDGHQIHTYAYDSLHNRLEKDTTSYRVNSLHATVQAGAISYGYDKAGNRTTMCENDRTTSYRYDSLDRLTAVENFSSRTEYLYDAFHRRIAKRIFAKGGIDTDRLEKEELYLYDHENEIGVVGSDGKIEELRLLATGMGAEIGASVAIELQQKLYVPLHDHRGNVSLLLDGTTGELAEYYRYTAFGEEELYDNELERMTEGSAVNKWRFSSKRIDSETGLIFFGRRYYDPTLGKWLTQDPLGLKAGPNLYAYVLNNPMTHIDLYGLFEQLVTGARSDPSSGRCGPAGSSHNAIGDAYTTVRDACCRTVDSLVHHLVPFEGIQSPICNTVRSWMGKGARKVDQCARVTLYDNQMNTLKESQSFVITSTCGINNTENHAKKAINSLLSSVDKLQVAVVMLVHNSSEGFLADFIELLCNRVGIETSAVRNLKAAWREIYNVSQAAGINQQVIHIVHSQAGWISYRAAEGLSKDLVNRISVITAGSTKLLSADDGFRKAMNIIHRSDLTPLIFDPIRYLSAVLFGSSEVQFIGSIFRVPFTTHSLLNEEYQEAIRVQLKKIMSNGK